jgi:hypothetical protein
MSFHDVPTVERRYNDFAAVDFPLFQGITAHPASGAVFCTPLAQRPAASSATLASVAGPNGSTSNVTCHARRRC